MTTRAMSREQVRAQIEEHGAGLWGATCTTDDGEDESRLAWDWIHGGATEEGVEIERGSVVVWHPTHTGGRRVRVTG